MLQEMIKAFLLIFVAEMGDKTQILALAFATRFPVKKVLAGIGIGAFLNHGLAVALGSYLSKVVPINTVQMIAGIAFVAFALWTLKPDDEEDGEEETKMRFGPTATVALAFFLGELGDKTQLTAITLAADAGYPLMILAGTVSGMIATGALGIFIGKKLGDRIPELGIKLLASTIFMFFGIQKLYQTVPDQYIKVYTVVPFLGILALVVFLMVKALLRRQREGIRSEFMAKARMLHDYYLHMKQDLEDICLGSEYCFTCQGSQCAVGRTKEIVQAALADQEWHEASAEDQKGEVGKHFNREKILDSLTDTLCLIETIHDEKSLANAHSIRKQLEAILLGRTIEEFRNIESYLKTLRQIDATLSARIEEMVHMREDFQVSMKAASGGR